MLVEAVHYLSIRKEKIAESATSMLMAISEQAADYIHEGAQAVSKAMQEAESKLKDYLNAPYGKRTAAKEDFFNAHRKVKKTLHENIDRIGKQHAYSLHKVDFISNRQKWLHKMKDESSGFNVTDTQAFQSATRLARNAKVVGKIFTLVELSMEVSEVFQTYLQGGDWQEEAVADTVSLDAAIFLSSLTSLILVSFTPAGWVVVLGAAGASLVGGLAGKFLVNRSMGKT